MISFCKGRKSNAVTYYLNQLAYAILNMAGADQRQDELFSIETLLAKGFSALKGLKVYIFSIGDGSY